MNVFLIYSYEMQFSVLIMAKERNRFLREKLSVRAHKIKNVSETVLCMFGGCAATECRAAWHNVYYGKILRWNTKLEDPKMLT